MEKHKVASRPRPSKKGGALRRVLLGFVLVALVMVLGIGCGFLTASMNTKPDIAEDIRPPASSQIYDINGNEIANIHAAENRMPVKISQIPKNLQEAFVAVEDNRFYEHMGVDPRGILRAAWANISGRTISEGGSTITQQLAKNAYLTQDQTYKRKIQEIFLALQLERQYTKQEILELYLNQIYFGQGAYGVEAAARTYFNKDVENLTLNECALLAGIPKSPNYYSPFNNLQAAQERKAVVLDQMVKYGYLSGSEAAKTKHEEVKLASPNKESGPQPAAYFIDYVTQLLVDKYGADAVYKDGLKIYTTIDMDMQKAAEAAMQNLPDYFVNDSGIQEPQGALVAIDPHTGYIKAMVGGRGTDQFNRATMAERQPGSAFKPFVFAAALENNFTPNTIIDDSKITVGDWSPQNYDRTFRGKVTLRQVAISSLNVPTVKVAQKIGMDKPLYYAQEMGITTFVLEGPRNDRNLASSLGGLTKGVTPLEITSAYGTFANKGVHVNHVAIIKVMDRNGKIMEQNEIKQRSVISEASAIELTSMLEDVIKRGTGTRASIGRPAAGKTGTTSDYHDAWFVGYTPDLVAGVWVGNDDNTSLNGMGGGNTPATIWKSFMTAALQSYPVKNFEGTSAYRSGAITELEEDKKSSRKSSKSEAKEEKKEDKQDTQGKPDANTPNATNNNNGDGKTPTAPAAQTTPVPATTPEPAAPSPTPTPAGAAPERGGATSKGRS
ncbi:MAG: penicillin-binding protein 1A [Selenomonadaceae bacterium]|nr:penicillin-binding protein 1A [Selenomonadaceae bacterium]